MLRITMIDRLPEDAQTLYAETIGLLLALERGRGLSAAFSFRGFPAFGALERRSS